MLPKSLKYQSKLESAMAKSYRTNIAPMNGTGTYNLGDTIIVNVATRRNLCLASTESYLKFNLVINNTSAANNSYRFDSGGAHGIIQRLRIFSGSNLIEDIDSYGLLAKMLFDIQQPDDTSKGKGNILCGTRNDFTTISNPGAVYAQNVPLSITNTNSGELVGNAIGAGAASPSRTYCLNLISILGALNSQNYFPLWACSSAPLRLEIQLVDQVMKFCACTSNTSTISITNVEYVANFIELNDTAISMINDSLGGQPLQFCVPEYRNLQYSYAFANGVASQVNVPVPAKYSSLKSLFLTMRDRGTGSATYFPHSCVKFGISNYYWRLGAQIVPTKAPDNLPEMFAECVKAIGSLADVNHQPSIDLPTYTLDVSPNNSDTTITNSSGSFYIGLDVEQYSASDRSTIFAGYNSNTDDIFAVVNLTAPTNATIRFDAFVLYDQVLVFENNTCYAKF